MVNLNLNPRCLVLSGRPLMAFWCQTNIVACGLVEISSLPRAAVTIRRFGQGCVLPQVIFSMRASG